MSSKHTTNVVLKFCFKDRGTPNESEINCHGRYINLKRNDKSNFSSSGIIRHLTLFDWEKKIDYCIVSVCHLKKKKKNNPHQKP